MIHVLCLLFRVFLISWSCMYTLRSTIRTVGHLRLLSHRGPHGIRRWSRHRSGAALHRSSCPPRRYICIIHSEDTPIHQRLHAYSILLYLHIMAKEALACESNYQWIISHERNANVCLLPKIWPGTCLLILWMVQECLRIYKFSGLNEEGKGKTFPSTFARCARGGVQMPA